MGRIVSEMAVSRTAPQLSGTNKVYIYSTATNDVVYVDLNAYWRSPQLGIAFDAAPGTTVAIAGSYQPYAKASDATYAAEVNWAALGAPVAGTPLFVNDTFPTTIRVTFTGAAGMCVIMSSS